MKDKINITISLSHLVISGIIFLLAPIILLFVFSNYPYREWFIYSGPVGDFINGIFSPFIAMAGAILIYLSFRAQTEANRLQIERMDKEFNVNRMEKKVSDLNRQFESIRNEFDKYVMPEDMSSYEGYQAITTFFERLKMQMVSGNELRRQNGYTEMLYINRVFVDFIERLLEAKTSDLISVRDIKYYAEIVDIFYSIKLAKYVEEILQLAKQKSYYADSEALIKILSKLKESIEQLKILRA